MVCYEVIRSVVLYNAMQHNEKREWRDNELLSENKGRKLDDTHATWSSLKCCFIR